jgi:hypothetical protein
MPGDASEYLKCKFSITCHTDDLAVVHCLRSLCQFAEHDLQHPQIGWGGSGEKKWKDDGRQITLRFTAPAYRDALVKAANKYLLVGCWREVRRSDNDPSSRQRSK